MKAIAPQLVRRLGAMVRIAADADVGEAVAVAMESDDVQADKSAAPTLAREGYYGLAGDWQRIVDPHTEAAGQVIVATFYLLFGSVVGRQPHFEVGPGGTIHANEFLLVLGRSGAGAKGDSLKAARLPFQKSMEPTVRAWDDLCVHHGSNSSAGLINLVRDPMQARNPETGEDEQVDPGCADEKKRALIQLSEYASLLRTFERTADTTSATFRDMWDSAKLENISKGNRATATNYHASLLGHCTPGELRTRLDGVSVANGFLNRHLAVWSERSKILPSPKRLDGRVLAGFVDRLDDAIRFAGAVDEMTRDEEAEALWCHVCPALLATGQSETMSALLERSRPHVVRLSMISALMDRSDVIRVPHLLAALALWDLSAATWAHVFAGEAEDPRQRRFMAALMSHGGKAMHSQMDAATGKNWSAADFAAIVDDLVRDGRVKVSTVALPGKGRPGKWYTALRASAAKPVLPVALAFLDARTLSDEF